MVAVVVPAGDYAAEKKLLDELGTYDEVDSTLGLSNVEAMGGYMLTDALTPRQFSELTDLDYEIAELLYAAYAADGGNYGKIIGGLPNYSVPLIDMFTFLYGEMQDGYVSLDADMTETLESAYSQITNARKQLQSDDYTRMLVYLNLPVGGDETYDFSTRCASSRTNTIRTARYTSWVIPRPSRTSRPRSRATTSSCRCCLS